jgi:hypothetical protein
LARELSKGHDRIESAGLSRGFFRRAGRHGSTAGEDARRYRICAPRKPPPVSPWKKSISPARSYAASALKKLVAAKD